MDVTIIYTGPTTDKIVDDSIKVTNAFDPDDSYIWSDVYTSGYLNSNAVGDGGSYGRSVYATDVDGRGESEHVVEPSSGTNVALYAQARQVAKEAEKQGKENVGITISIDGYLEELYWNQIAPHMVSEGFYTKVGDNEYGPSPAKGPSYTVVYDTIPMFHGQMVMPDPVTRSISYPVVIADWVSSLAPSIVFQGWTTDVSVAEKYWYDCIDPKHTYMPTPPNMIYISNNDRVKIVEKNTEYSDMYQPDPSDADHTITLYAIFQSVYYLTLTSYLNRLGYEIVVASGDSEAVSSRLAYGSAYSNVQVQERLTFNVVSLETIFDKMDSDPAQLISIYNFNKYDSFDYFPSKYSGLPLVGSDVETIGWVSESITGNMYYIIPVSEGNSFFIQTTDYSDHPTLEGDGLRFGYVTEIPAYGLDIKLASTHSIFAATSMETIRPTDSRVIAPSDAKYFMIQCTCSGGCMIDELYMYNNVEQYDESHVSSSADKRIAVGNFYWSFAGFDHAGYKLTRTSLVLDYWGVYYNAEAEAYWYNEEYDAYSNDPASYVPGGVESEPEPEPEPKSES